MLVVVRDRQPSREPHPKVVEPYGWGDFSEQLWGDSPERHQCFGRPARLVWHKQRWWCAQPDCESGSWTVSDPRIARPGHV